VLLQLAAAQGALRALAAQLFADRVGVLATAVSAGQITAREAAIEITRLAALLARNGT